MSAVPQIIQTAVQGANKPLIDSLDQLEQALDIGMKRKKGLEAERRSDGGQSGKDTSAI